jgi:hypothetical protein
MIVIDPNTTEHVLKFVPRYYPCTVLVATLRNDADDTSEALTHTYYNDKGFLYLSFTKTFTEGGSFDLTLTESGEVVYRGKIQVTAQTAQTYQSTTDYYIYG